MSRVVELLCSRRVPQAAVLALMSIRFCRLQRRYVDAPLARFLFQSLYIPAGSDRFGPDAHGRAPRASAICPSAVSIAVSIIGVAAADRGAAVLSDRRVPACPEEGAGLASYSPPAHPIESTGTVAPRSVAATHGLGQGGTTIIVGTSDTLEILSRRYNVSSAAIMQANGYKGPRALSPGQQLIIPHPAASVAAAPALAAPASKPVAVASAAPSVHVVNHGDTLLSIARRNHVPVAELAKANKLEPSSEAQARHEAHRAGREDRGCCAGCAAGGGCRGSARRGTAAARDQNGRRDGRSASKPRVWPRPPPRSRTRQRLKRRSRPARQPARCRPSAGRCAAR